MRIKVNGNKSYSHIDVNTYYCSGGYNFFTGEVEERGYYVECCPVQFDGHNVAHAIFEGYKKFLKPCKRFSGVTMNRLCDLTLENAGDLIEHVCKEYGLVIDEEVA